MSQVEKVAHTHTQQFDYLTTAINYTNGPPHLGHCFEAILADVLARYRALFHGPDRPVFLQTGTDEHGLKIAQTAASRKLTPQQLCDQYAEEFRTLAETLGINYQSFVRTTHPGHRQMVQALFLKLQIQDDIYSGEYEGWYNVREETYVTEREAESLDYRDPVSQQPLIKVREPSYFFRLSKYQSRVQTYLETPGVIIPDSKRLEVLQRLKSQPLKDLSISRTTFDWGIPVPNDTAHCLYVWLDALFNYYTGPQILDQTDTQTHAQALKPEQYWPPSLQVIGKDIIWFHAVIWPGLLMAADLALPQQIYVHDFIVGENGQKMSKSVGNVVDLDHLLKTYPVETLRYYLLRECSYDSDLKFSEQRLIQTQRAELADKLGNLAHRILVMTKKFSDDQIPSTPAQTHPPIYDLTAWQKAIQQAVETYHFPDLLMIINEKVHQLNQHIVEEEPWNILTPGDKKIPLRTEEDRARIMRTVLEGLFQVAVVWQPLQPTIAEKIFHRLGFAQSAIIGFRNFKLSQLNWDNLPPGQTVSQGPVLFKKF